MNVEPKSGEIASKDDDKSMELNLWFDHGLGDCANFAHVLELYKRRGYRINLHCADDKAAAFSAQGVARIPVDHPNLQYVYFCESPDPSIETADQYWLYNKVGINVTGSPLPAIGTSEELWEELYSTKIDVSPWIIDESRKSVADFLEDLPKPIVLIHSMGNTSPDQKNIPEDTAIELYRQLLDRIGGTLVLLDWDNRVARMANWRVRHMVDDWKWIDVTTLLALFQQCDLLISVDSGPLHLSRLTDIPVVGLYPSLTKYPGRVSLPRGRTVNIVPHGITHELNKKTRILFNIVESPGYNGFEPSFIADVAAQMLSGPRYLASDQLGADMQLQQFVLDWERGHGNSLSQYIDRHLGFDKLIKEVLKRFDRPVIVETGCIRGEEDWRGAGYSTYLLGTVAHRTGGELHSVDNNFENCAFARSATRELRGVSITHGDSVDFLAKFKSKIDILLIDSMDTEIPGHEQHALNEVTAALHALHENSIVIFDDTPYRAKKFTGKGTLAVPWLLENGWKILHSGYQTICVRL